MKRHRAARRANAALRSELGIVPAVLVGDVFSAEKRRAAAVSPVADCSTEHKASYSILTGKNNSCYCRRSQGDLGSAVAEMLHLPRSFAQLADPFSDEPVHMHTSFDSARAAAGLPKLTGHPGRLFGWPPAGSMRVVDALALQGRCILAYRDAVRQAEAAAKRQRAAAAAAAAGSTGSRPWWQPWQRFNDVMKPGSGGGSSAQHGAEAPEAPQRWQRFSELPPQGLPRLSSLNMGIALKLLDAHPGHALLMPDAKQVCVLSIELIW